MPALLRRLAAPLLLKVDFTDRFWRATPTAARAWLVGAVAADLLAQTFFGHPSLFTVIASLFTLAVFWRAPAILAAAAGGLYVGQAVVSVLLVGAVSLAGSTLLAEGAGFIWWGWCMFALAKLILLYIRTPKAAM